MTYIKAFFIAVHAVFIAILTILISPFDTKGKGVLFLSKIFSKGILFIAGVKVEAEGLNKFDHSKSYIFVSNHQSYFDIPVMMSVIPNNLRFIYKDSLTKIPVFGWGMYLGGYIPINRDNPREAVKSLSKAAEKIKNGISVTIFPEGTRSPDGKMKEFKKGAFVLAEKSGVPIVPVTINGSYKIMPKDKFRINSGRVKVIFESPVEYTREKDFVKKLHDVIEKNISNS